MYFNNVQNTIRDFQSRRAALDADRELSDYGRQLRQARLQNEIGAYHNDALIFLRADYQALKKSFDDWQAQTREAQERSSAAWDYQRLAYGAESLRSQLAQAFASENTIAGTGSVLAKIEQQFKRVSDLGDKHTQRTWAEIAPAVIRAHASGIEAAILSARLA